MTLARAENVEGVLKEIKDSAQAKVNDTYYATLADAIKAAKEALEGTNTVNHNGRSINMGSMLYFSGRVSGAKLSIGNHQFK